MTIHFADIARGAAADRAISDAEIAALRSSGWADGIMMREEAEAIFATHDVLDHPSAEWADFFIEAMREYVLNGSGPRGFASDAEAQWLIDHIKQDGRICSVVELELLVSIIEKAHNLPQNLKDFVLKTIEAEVLSGNGPLRNGGTLADTHINAAECALVRRVIFAAGGDRPASVSREEAEMLFRLKHATSKQSNAPEFKRLFVHGVGNFLMGFASENAQISRERMVELHGFIADNKPSLSRFMGRMAQSAPNAFGAVFNGKPIDPSYEVELADAARITTVEQEWLDRQIAANGVVDGCDQALLEFIAEEIGRA